MQIKKASTILLVLLIVLVSMAPVYSDNVQAYDPIIQFECINLENAVRRATRKEVGDIYKSDVEKIRFLSWEPKIENEKITSLKGIEYLTNLDSLYLSGNEIKTINELSNLDKLTIIYLDSNQITDVSPLSNLTKLGTLSLSSNNISDLKPLSGLTRLTRLELDSNIITDISPLSKLIELETLKLSSNNIRDLNVSGELVNLIELDLRSNEISDISPLFGKNNKLIYPKMYMYAVWANPLKLDNNKIPQSQIDLYKPILWNRFNNQFYYFGEQNPDKEKTGSIIIEYKDEYDKELLATETYDNVVGTNTYFAKEIEGYSLTKGEPYVKTLVIKEEGQSIKYTFRYTKEVDGDGAIEFQCENLEAIVRKQIDKRKVEGKIYKEDVDQIYMLSVPKTLEFGKITSLKGIEYFTRLEVLDLNDNEISDLSPIAGLVMLKELNLSKNKITDLSKLGGLERLMILKLDNNEITDISDLSNLKNLSYLSLKNNYISNINVLGEIRYLFNLYLDSNQISDITGLKKFKTLYNLHLTNNQIQDISPLFDQYNQFIYYNMKIDGLKLDNNEIPQSQINKYKPILETHFGGNFDFGIQNQVEERMGTIVILYKDLAGNDILPARLHEYVMGTRSYTAEEVKGYRLVEGQSRDVNLTISYDGQVLAYTFIYDLIGGKDFVIFKHQGNIANDKPWTIVFSQPIDFDNLIKGKSIYITDENNFLWDAEFMSGNNLEEVKIVASSEYKSGETYTLWIINVNNLNGEELRSNYKMSFTIQ